MVAPADFGVELVGVPAGADIELDIRLEAVMEGVLVSGTVRAPLTGECARCLDPVTSSIEVGFQELFCYLAARVAGDSEATEEDHYLDGDLLDLEPVCRTRCYSRCRSRRSVRATVPASALSAVGGSPTSVRSTAMASAPTHVGRRWGCWTQPTLRPGPAGVTQTINRRADVAVPKRKMSRSNTRARRARWKSSAPVLMDCPQCHEQKLPHTACPTCGTYNGRQVATPA